MPNTGTTLRATAQILTHFGIDHTGAQYATNEGRLTVPAGVFRAVTGSTPNAFLTDREHSARLIEANETAMDAIRMVSLVLDTHPPTDDNGRDDHLEHVLHWSTTAAPGDTEPPTALEVIGRIIRAARTADYLSGQPIHPRPYAA